MSEWKANQANRICFVMVDATGVEVAGLGNTFTLQLSKDGGAFAPSAGAKAEIGNGWYTYLATAAEADTPGPVAIRVTGAGAVQQNLEYVVTTRVSGAVMWVYTVTNAFTLAPIPDVTVYATTDAAGTIIVGSGVTDALGQVTFLLPPGNVYFWSSKAGFSFANPDLEVVS